jgi:hypothetical protein
MGCPYRGVVAAITQVQIRAGGRTAGRRGGRTERRDRWWLSPLGTAVFLGGLSAYALWAGLQTSDFAVGSYVSPLFSPCVAADCGTHATFDLVGGWWRWSPALLVIAVPIGVRATCYYYRKLYYRSFWLSPPACAVGEPRRTQSGESRFPLVWQNAHRYLWALGVVVAVMLSADAVEAFRQPGGIGVGVGTVLIVANGLAFWGYLLGCHACRHLVGGGSRSLAARPLRRRLWARVSRLNARHGLFALISLPLVMVTDGYVRLVASGVIADPHVTWFG